MNIRIWLLFSLFFITPTLLMSQNVLVTDKANPNEPCIMIDPKNPNILLAAANINNFSVSLDTGRTWTLRPVNSTYGVWGDPAIAVDTAGDIYFFHLSNPVQGNWIDRIVCQKSADKGLTFNNGSYMGLNGAKAQDKEWMTIDPKTNTIYVTWTQFDNYGSAAVSDSSIILFSKSVDSGASWTPPKRISYWGGDCIDVDNTVEGAVPAVGPDGQLYVAWAGPKGLVFNRSYDGGDTWLERENKVDPMPTGWDYRVGGIYRANGLPITACDNSQGPNRGTIYINWSDQRNGSNNTDIWLVKSTDQGNTWSAPIKVNDDNTNRQQFFTWMTIDQTTGFIYCVFYDRRNYDDFKTDVFIAVSTDGGKTFVNKKISETPFIPNENIFFGDYTNIVAHNGIVRPIWTRLHNGKLSVWTDLTSEKKILSTTKEIIANADKFDFETYPNPSSQYTYVSFKLRKPAFVSISLQNMHGQIVKSIIKDAKMDSGKYIERIELQSLDLPSATYFVHLKIDGEVKVHRMIKI